MVAAQGGLATRRPALATFGVMVIAIVGGGVLALPTALSGFGAARAALIVVVMGLVNLATLSSLAGAIARSTAPSSGRGRLATLTSEHLGHTGALIALIASVLLWFGLLVVYVLGLSGSLASLAGPSWMWALVATGVIATLVFTQARELFVAAATAVAVINLVILLALITLVAIEVDPDLLTSRPSHAGSSGTGALELVFGTVLFSFFGHTALFSVAPEVARADPSGRSLRRGAMAAMIAAIVINVSWVVVCLGIVPAERFAGESSTGVALLGEYAGPALEPLAALFAVLALGFAGLNAAFALGDVIGERLPGLRRLSTILRTGSSVEIVEPNSFASITIAAAHERGEQIIVARGRRGRTQRREVISGSTWDGQTMLRDLGVSRRHAVIRVKLDGVAAGGTVIGIETTLPITEHEPPVQRAALLGGDDTDQLGTLLVQASVRRPGSVDDIVATVSDATGASPTVLTSRLHDLITLRRLVIRDGEVHPVLGSRHRAKTALVNQLYAELVGETASAPDDNSRTGAVGRREALADGAWRRAALAMPAPLALVTVLGLLASGASFASVLDLVAMAAIVLLAGVLPLLLDMSLRRRAERPAATSRLVSQPVQLGLLVLFAAVTVLYAVVIYQAWYQRLVAAIAFVISATTMIASRRAGAFSPRSTLMVESAADGALSAVALDGGRPTAVEVRTGDVEGRRSLIVDAVGGLTPPLLLLALDGEAVPAVLGEWTVRVNGAPVGSGYLEDAAGEVLDWGSGTPSDIVQCSWHLR